MDSSDADVVVLTETWLSSKIRNDEILNCHKRFNFYRHDRGEKNGGGVLVAVAENVLSFQISIVSELELLWVCLQLKTKKYILGVCYRPPSKSATFVTSLHDAINGVMMRFPNTPIMLLGDFNYPAIVWSDMGASLSPFSSESNEFLNFCLDFSFS